ncbi:MAG: cytochrome b [Herbaspirillum sp.]|jgi:cytochrome b561|nr:cytochrome b [Herbaspirillum sp.]
MRTKRYHPTSMFLHWAIFLLMAAALTFMESRSYLPKDDPLSATLRRWHMLAGQLVLLLVVFRIAARFMFGVPPLQSGPRWQMWIAHAVHAFLYLLMLALPITGILFNQAGGRDVSFFGWVLPHLIAPDKALGTIIRHTHDWLGNAVFYVVGLHILGVLWHQFVRKDNGLMRMAPGRDEA